MKLTTEQQARFDAIVAALPVSVTRSPKPGERNRLFVRPFEGQQDFTLTREGVTAQGEIWRKVEATIRWDDQCGNGHNSFSITGSAWSPRNFRKNDPDMCGCMHELIAEVFPEVAHLIKYHLTNADGPMHYVANTLYHSSDRDCWGRKAGEPYNFKPFYLIGTSPIEVEIPQKVMGFVRAEIENGAGGFGVESVPYDGGNDYKFGPKFKLTGMPTCKWHECPFDRADYAVSMANAFSAWIADPDFIKVIMRPTSTGEGKIPDFEAARRCAVWPDATDDQLQDADQLIERIPLIMDTFKAELEAFAVAHGWEGFTY